MRNFEQTDMMSVFTTCNTLRNTTDIWNEIPPNTYHWCWH